MCVQLVTGTLRGYFLLLGGCYVYCVLIKESAKSPLHV